MNAKSSAVIELVRNVSIPKPASEARAFAAVHPDHEPCSAAGIGNRSLDGYQIALISFDTHADPSRDPAREAAIPHLLLLPLMWSDLLKQMRQEAGHSQYLYDREVAQFGEVCIDFVRYEARRADQLVELTAIEFKILRFFVSNPCRVISRDELLDKVWGYHWYPATRTVDNRIMILRQKLEREPANPVHFQTVHGVGYKFVP